MTVIAANVLSFNPFAGIVGTGDFATDQRPMSWRSNILRLYPNGQAPLTALLAMANQEAVNDPQFHWWAELNEHTVATPTGIYCGTGIVNAYDANGATYNKATYGVAGGKITVKMVADSATRFVAGHQVVIRDTTNFLDTYAKVDSVTVNGASSFIACTLLADEPGAADGTTGLEKAITTGQVIVTGTINAEGGVMPAATSQKPQKFYNYTQIFRNSLEITRTAELTALRTNPGKYQEMKMKLLEKHSMEMEMALLFGIGTETVTSGTTVERTTQGIINFVTNNLPGNVRNYKVDYASKNPKTWVAEGANWIDETLELYFRYGANSKLALCGSGALLGIQRAVKASGTMQLNPLMKIYGMNVTEWVTPFGSIYLKTHPLMSQISSLRNSAVLLEPGNVKQRVITDTTYYDDPNGNNQGTRRADAKAEEFLTEMGFEYNLPHTFGIMHNIGIDG